VVSTKHNLSQNLDILATGNNQEVCIFCHTPHGGNVQGIGSAPAGAAPLWNRRLPDSGTYTIYSAPNFDAAGTDAGKPKGVSLACLSCHDGTIALDAIINAPGSGGFYIANLLGIGGAGESNPNIDFSGPAMGPDQSLAEGLRTDHGATGVGTIAGGSEPFPNLGVDLSNDHPIGMEIPATDPQFTQIRANASTEGGTAGKSIWFLRRDGQTLQTDKRDRVRAYPSTGETDKMYIECASCHNPHTPRPLFLRLPKLPGTDTSAPKINPNQSSALCLTCHQK
jgi:hypothetical protein